MNIFVLGAGTMGSGIAQTFAETNCDVLLGDINEEFLERGHSLIERNLDIQIKKGNISKEQKFLIFNRISTTTKLEDAKNCDLVVEAVVEKIDTKKQVFEQLDSICKENTILASNTSSLSITEIASATKRPNKVIGMHFFNPAPIMQLIEITKGICTSEETTQFIINTVKTIGKESIEIEESPGFVVNRILIPMINEAVGVKAEGTATAEEIDKAMVLGARHPIGPLALADLIGLDVCLHIMQNLYKEYGDSKYRAHPYLKKMVRANKLGRKTGEGFYNY